MGGAIAVGTGAGVGVGAVVGANVGALVGVGVKIGSGVGLGCGVGVAATVSAAASGVLGLASVGVGTAFFTVKAKGLRLPTWAVALSAEKSTVVGNSRHPPALSWCWMTILDPSLSADAMVDRSSSAVTVTGTPNEKSSTSPVSLRLTDRSNTLDVLMTSTGSSGMSATESGV